MFAVFLLLLSSELRNSTSVCGDSSDIPGTHNARFPIEPGYVLPSDAREEESFTFKEMEKHSRRLSNARAMTYAHDY
jgi:hypothetical protein